MSKKLLSFILIILLMAGCSSDKTELESGTGGRVEPESGGILTMACVPVDTLNPLVTVHASIADVMSLVYEGLFVTNSDYTVTPVLATGYIASENNTVYTVKLKDSVNFHNGRTFTSADVVATLDYIAVYGGTYSSVVSNIEAYWAENADTVVIRLKKSISDFMNNFDFPILPSGLADASFQPQNEGFVPVGTGMYRYDSTLNRKNIILKANNDWHGGEKRPYIDTVDVSILTDEETIISAFDVGYIDVISTSWKDMVDMNLTSSMYNTFETEQNKFTFIGINCNSTLFDTVQERRYLSDSVDRKALTDDIMIGHAVVADSPVRDSAYFDLASEGDRAETELPPAATEDKPGECRLLYNSGSKTKSRLASAIKQQLEARGYVVTLDEHPYETYCDKILLDDYDLYIGEVKTDNSGNISFMFGSDSRPGRICNYYDSEFENLVANLDRMNNKDDKSIAWNNFENYYTDKVVQIPLYFTNSAVLINKRISGNLNLNISNLYSDFSNLFIENEK